MTASAENPYRDALKGLTLPDPVKAFFDWCIERDNIRRKREAGEPPPWTQDPVFQKGRFLNVFREDDKGSKAVLKFATPVKDSTTDLIHALFFARWCNQYSTLMALDPALLTKPDALRHALLHDVPQPWFSDVYPVVPAHWEGKEYNRLDAAIDLFPLCRSFLEQSIRQSRDNPGSILLAPVGERIKVRGHSSNAARLAPPGGAESDETPPVVPRRQRIEMRGQSQPGGNVITATNLINAQFKMTNDFPIFMAVIDLAWFKPDLISPDSPVPTGIGAAPFLDLLQKHLNCANHHETEQRMIDLQPKYWPAARRKLCPIDIEYACCECRKYYSYITGTKKFEGRNLFTPSRP
jgi:hypothetical protein